jgi:phage recombination protein Bet
MSMTDAQTRVLRAKFDKLTDDEFAAFLDQAKAYKLDPSRGQIIALTHWDKKAQKNRVTYMTGIDGFRGIAEDTGDLAGCDAPIYEYDDRGNLFSAAVTVYRMVKGERCPFTAIAFWDEYYKNAGEYGMHNKMPRLMLAKCAEALALRKAFTRLLFGLYTTDEMKQAMVEDDDAQATPQTTRETPAFSAADAKGAVPVPPKQALVGIIGVVTGTMGKDRAAKAKELVEAAGLTAVTDDDATNLEGIVRDMHNNGFAWPDIVRRVSGQQDKPIADSEPITTDDEITF